MKKRALLFIVSITIIIACFSNTVLAKNEKHLDLLIYETIIENNESLKVKKLKDVKRKYNELLNKNEGSYYKKTVGAREPLIKLLEQVKNNYIKNTLEAMAVVLSHRYIKKRMMRLIITSDKEDQLSYGYTLDKNSLSNMVKYLKDMLIQYSNNNKNFPTSLTKTQNNEIIILQLPNRGENENYNRVKKINEFIINIKNGEIRNEKHPAKLLEKFVIKTRTPIRYDLTNRHNTNLTLIINGSNINRKIEKCAEFIRKISNGFNIILSESSDEGFAYLKKEFAQNGKIYVLLNGGGSEFVKLIESGEKNYNSGTIKQLYEIGSWRNETFCQYKNAFINLFKNINRIYE